MVAHIGNVGAIDMFEVLEKTLNIEAGDANSAYLRRICASQQEYLVVKLKKPCG